EEVVDLGVELDGQAEVDVGPGPGVDEVVAVHGGRHRGGRQAGGHELEQRHLGGGVLHGQPVGVEVAVAAAPLELLAVGVAQVVDQDLLRPGERSAEPFAAEGDPFGQPGVDLGDPLGGGGGGAGHDGGGS